MGFVRQMILDAYLTCMRFEGDMDCMAVNRSKQMEELLMHTAKMTCDVISLGAGGSAIFPFASET